MRRRKLTKDGIVNYMEGYIVSIQNGLLKVSLSGTDQVAEKTVGVGLSDPKVLAEELGSLILDTFGSKAKKFPLNFLVDPQDIHLNFLTVGKGEKEKDQLFELAKSKLGEQGVAVENLYLSYQKIAPFVYQLVATDKEVLEKYLDVSTELGYELRSVIPWALLLPKHISNSGDAAIFVLNTGANRFLILSELGGVYHLGLLDDTKSAEELEELIQKLSVYQRNTPITSIYTLNISDLKLGDKYKVSSLDIGDLHSFVAQGCSDEETLTTQLNLLTLLPLPEKTNKKSPMVYVGGVLAALLFVGGIFGVRALKSNDLSDEQLEVNTEDSSVVLSDVNESTESEDKVDEETSEKSSDTEVDLNKAYLRIRIENGTLIGGLAGKTRDHLAEAGYEVVSIGDSDESERAKTLVKFNEDNVLYKDLLLEDLGGLYETFEVVEDLAGELEYDVLIVVGTDDDTENQ